MPPFDDNFEAASTRDRHALNVEDAGRLEGMQSGAENDQTLGRETMAQEPEVMAEGAVGGEGVVSGQQQASSGGGLAAMTPAPSHTTDIDATTNYLGDAMFMALIDGSRALSIAETLQKDRITAVTEWVEHEIERYRQMDSMTNDGDGYSGRGDLEEGREHGYRGLDTPISSEAERASNQDTGNPSQLGHSPGRGRAVFEYVAARLREFRSTDASTLAANDPAEDFLLHLINFRQSQVVEYGFRYVEPRLGDNARYRFWLATGVANPTQVRNFHDLTMELGTLESRMMIRAAEDKMDVKNGEQFIRLWLAFLLSWEQPYPDIVQSIPVRALMFWVALRRGWGSWQPSDAMNDHVWNILNDATRFIHTPTAAALTGNALRSEMTRSILTEGLPIHEANTFRRLRDQNPPFDGFFLIMREWLALRDHCEETRLESEAHIEPDRLLLNRLERLIREHRVMNARRIILPWW